MPEDSCAALAAAVENEAEQRHVGKPPSATVASTLDDVLYACGDGGDGVLELTVAESSATQLTIVGLVIWVDQTLAPLEATFELDRAGIHVRACTVCAGDRRIARGDRPLGASWRTQLRMIADRPTRNEDWECVFRWAVS